MLAVYIQYQYIYITKCQLSLLIGIGYILPTFGDHTSFGGFLCALRAQGWGIFLVRNVHFFLICIHTCIRYKLPTFGEYMLVGGFVCAGLGNMSGQECTFSYMYTCIGYKLPTSSPRTSAPVDKCPCGQVPPGQVPLRTTSPRTSSPGRQASKKDNFPPDKFHFGQVPPRGKLSGGNLSGGNLSASRSRFRVDNK